MKLRHSGRLALCMLVTALAATAAQGKTVCTVIVDAGTGSTLRQEGNCGQRVTPASTFKIAISLMGYDSGLLKDEHAPTLPYHKSYVDWGGDNWRQPTDPARWIQYSVVWFSQQMTHALGAARLQKYAREFDYGNADISGDPGQHNGLERSWISSSLKISPLEQIAFLRKLVNRQLPVTSWAFEMTQRITLLAPLSNGWEMHGKTGAAFPRNADGSFNYTRGHGWFVGWATKENRTLVFARLIQDEKKEEGTPGVRARDALLKELPAFLDAAGNQDANS